MNTTKHSPAPWKAVISYETLDGMRQDLCPLVVDANGVCICELWSSTQTITPITQATQEANARIMARAPEMRDGLVDLIEQIEAWERLTSKTGIDTEPVRLLLESIEKGE